MRTDADVGHVAVAGIDAVPAISTMNLVAVNRPPAPAKNDR